ncbi:MAG: AAA family ATPase, partial [Candidatus Cloacimonadota bacterium]|nr:AAA family ATPase [Candidatus Cloacimonadota bacterium]
EEAQYNSPWNIAADYDVDMTFNPNEIETMLVQYQNETKTEMNTKEIAGELYFYTSGYPYFVSKLCKIIDEKIKPEKWKKEHIVETVKILLDSRNNTNFDSLIKNIENNKELAKFIEKVILGSREYNYESSSPLISFGEMHGIFSRNDRNKLKIHNKIYEEKITNYILSKLETSNNGLNSVQSIYVKPDGRLDLKKVLLKFQEAVEEKYSKTDLMKSNEFLENNLRMLFLMFLKPIINGVGFSFKEPQTSAEKRLDIVVMFKDEKFIIELKLWYGEKYHKQGIEQIKDYMKREHCKDGYMIIMSKNNDKKFTTTDEDGIFTIWL